MVKKKNRIGETVTIDDNYMNLGSKSKKRWHAIVEQNDRDELGVVGLESKKRKNNIKLRDYKAGNKKDTYYSMFLEIKNYEGSPLKVGNDVKQNNSSSRLNDKQLSAIRKTLYDKSYCKERNIKARNYLYRKKDLDS